MNRLVCAALIGCAAWLSACGSPIVGAECKAGFVVCDGECVALDSDPAHCGVCGHDCGAFECSSGSCGPGLRDGGGDGGDPLDGGGLLDGGSLSDGGTRPPPTQGSGSSGFPFLPDGGFDFPDPIVSMGCELGETECGDHCADLQRDVDNCGACGAICGVEQYCVDGMCEDRCDLPLRLCNDSCVDFSSDEQNCGDCGTDCASGLCEAGMCADVVSGHVVVIGHDYTSVRDRGNRPQTIQWLAGNAVFIASGDPVRALVYRGAAQPESIAGATRAIDAVANATGRAWAQTLVEVDDVSEQLLGANVFVIHAQRGASDAELTELGQRWGLAMAQFLRRGGVIVVFETVSGSNAGTFQLLEPASLFTADGREPTSGRLDIERPRDSLATNTTGRYTSQVATVRFTGLPSSADVVVEDSTDAAVVVHRVAQLP